MIEALHTFYVKHPEQAFLIWTVFLYFFGVFAQSLRAPTAQSSQLYVSFFQICNAAASNLHRASIPKVESSPNFQAAAEIYLQNKQREAIQNPSSAPANQTNGGNT
jgi:hypothetical protein